MGQFSKERMRAFDDISWKYYDWLAVLNEAGVKEIQDLQGQYLLKCPFHEDWKPSFRIRLHEHNYHCFSCGAFGSVANLMWRLSESQLPQGQFYEQLLKANPPIQRELGFNSLYLDARTLDPALAKRRRFNAKNAIGSQMPISVLSSKVRAMQNTWEGLVYSLTMLQQGESTDNICAQMGHVASVNQQGEADRRRVNVMSLDDILKSVEEGDA